MESYLYFFSPPNFFYSYIKIRSLFWDGSVPAELLSHVPNTK